MADIDRHRREVRSNYTAFRELLPNLLPQHEGQYALMRAQELVGFFPSADAAYRHGMETFEDGLFSIQTVSERPIDLGALSHARIRSEL